MIYWEERNFPWLDAAHLHLDQTLTVEEMDKLEFDANRTHDSINLPLARTANDFASMGHARALIYWHAQKGPEGGAPTSLGLTRIGASGGPQQPRAGDRGTGGEGLTRTGRIGHGLYRGFAETFAKETCL